MGEEGDSGFGAGRVSSLSKINLFYLGAKPIST